MYDLVFAVEARMHGVVARERDEELREAVRARLAATGEAVRCFRDWSGVRNGSQAFDSLVVVFPSAGSHARWVHGLVSMRMTHRWLPMVLVVPERHDPSWLQRAAPHVDAVVATRELAGGLASAVDQAGVKRFLRRVEGRLERSSGVPARLRRAIAVVLRAEPPLRTVNALAASLGMDRSGLQRMWSAHPAELNFHEGVGLKDLLAAVVVMRAVAVRKEVGDWDEAADEVGVHVETLRRRIRAWLGVSLAELAEWAAPLVCERVWRRISVDGGVGAGRQDVE